MYRYAVSKHGLTGWSKLYADTLACSVGVSPHQQGPAETAQHIKAGGIQFNSRREDWHMC